MSKGRTYSILDDISGIDQEPMNDRRKQHRLVSRVPAIDVKSLICLGVSQFLGFLESRRILQLRSVIRIRMQLEVPLIIPEMRSIRFATKDSGSL